MISALTGVGVTILSTIEVEESFQNLDFSEFSLSFLTDDVIRVRYVEIDGQLRKIMVVVKVRGAAEPRRRGNALIQKRAASFPGL